MGTVTELPTARPAVPRRGPGVVLAASARYAAFLRREIALLPEHHRLRGEYLDQLHGMGEEA